MDLSVLVSMTMLALTFVGMVAGIIIFVVGDLRKSLGVMTTGFVLFLLGITMILAKSLAYQDVIGLIFGAIFGLIGTGVYIVTNSILPKEVLKDQ